MRCDLTASRSRSISRGREEEVGTHRPLADVIHRTTALYSVLAIPEGGSFEIAYGALVERDLLPWLSEKERRYIAGRQRGEEDERERVQLSWRVECMLALGWALELFDEVPVERTRPAPAEAFDPLYPEGFAAGPSPAIRLRPAETLAQHLDLFYCAHWAVRENQLTGDFEPWPEQLVPGAIWERHALSSGCSPPTSTTGTTST